MIDDWIEHIRILKIMDKPVHLRQKAKNAFDLRYQSDVRPDENRWELCSRMLASSDIVERLSRPW